MNVCIIHSSWRVGMHLSVLLTMKPNIHVIGEACYASQGIAMIQEHRPRLVLIDAALEDGLWRTVLSAAKDLEPPAVAIVTATCANTQYHRESLRAGADHYCELPRQMREMTTLIELYADILV